MFDGPLIVLSTVSRGTVSWSLPGKALVDYSITAVDDPSTIDYDRRGHLVERRIEFRELRPVGDDEYTVGISDGCCGRFGIFDIRILLAHIVDSDGIVGYHQCVQFQQRLNQ